MWKKIKEKLNKICNYLFEDYAPCNKDIIKTLENIETLDDVWIEKDGEIKRGWIWEINKKAIRFLCVPKIKWNVLLFRIYSEIAASM